VRGDNTVTTFNASMARTTAIISLSILVTSIKEIVLFQEGERNFVCRAPGLKTPFAFVITQLPQSDKAIRVSSRDKDLHVEIQTAYNHGQYAVWAHLMNNHNRAHSLQGWRSSALNLKDRHPATSMPSARRRPHPHRS